MDGQVAQILSMTAFANAELDGSLTGAYSLESPTAIYCNKIFFIDWIKSGSISSFMSRKQGYRSQPIADNFSDWIAFLKHENIRQLYLHDAPSVDCRGNSRWIIEAWNGKFSDYWEAKWKVTHKDAPDKRIWSVAYARVSRIDQVRKEEHCGLAGIKSELSDALKAGLDFIEKNPLEKWKISFSKALNYLETGDRESILIDQEAVIPVSCYSEEARRILFAAQAAWVFQGDEPQNYHEMWKNLFPIISKAISHGINAYVSKRGAII